MLVLLAQVSSATTFRLPTEERQGLLELYRSTQGDGWTEKKGWGGPEGTEWLWKGLYCVEDPPGSNQTHVLWIDLPRNNLRGPLPESLASLPSLHRIDVSGNSISMPIPAALVRRWETGRLDIETGGPFDSFDEIRLRVINPTFCTNEAIVFHADGSAFHFRENCRWPKPDVPGPYCEVRRATAEKFAITADFAELSRFLVTNGIFGFQYDPLAPIVIDARTATVEVKGAGGFHFVDVDAESKDSMRLWSYEMVVRGVAQQYGWSAPAVSDQCPWRRAQ